MNYSTKPDTEVAPTTGAISVKYNAVFILTASWFLLGTAIVIIVAAYPSHQGLLANCNFSVANDCYDWKKKTSSQCTCAVGLTYENFVDELPQTGTLNLDGECQTVPSEEGYYETTCYVFQLNEGRQVFLFQQATWGFYPIVGAIIMAFSFLGSIVCAGTGHECSTMDPATSELRLGVNGGCLACCGLGFLGLALPVYMLVVMVPIAANPGLCAFNNLEC